MTEQNVMLLSKQETEQRHRLCWQVQFLCERRILTRRLPPQKPVNRITESVNLCEIYRPSPVWNEL
jgi:hypothetical protein